MKEKIVYRIASCLFFLPSFLLAPAGMEYAVAYFGGDESLSWLLSLVCFFTTPLAFGYISKKEKEKIKQTINNNFSKTMPHFNEDGQILLAKCRYEIEQEIGQNFFGRNN